ncbi:unnamed protein product [Rhizophagus irregularis]|nr:unnamed protein product [Rhizophagus irregularis]
MSIIPKNNKCCAVLDEVDVYSDVYTSDNRKLWDNRTIPYKFDKDISFELKTSVMKAMERIAEGVKAKSGTNSKIGQRERLSSGDKLALNKLYPRVVFLFRKKIVLNRRNLRRLRRLTSNYLTYNLSKLPRQNTNNLTINNFFNGYPFDPDADPDADPIDSK